MIALSRAKTFLACMKRCRLLRNTVVRRVCPRHASTSSGAVFITVVFEFGIHDTTIRAITPLDRPRTYCHGGMSVTPGLGCRGIWCFTLRRASTVKWVQYLASCFSARRSAIGALFTFLKFSMQDALSRLPCHHVALNLV